MSDFNFFEPFIEPPAKQSSSRLLWLIVLGAIAIAITYIQVSYYADKASIEASIEEQRAYLTSEAVVSKTAEINEKEAALKRMRAVSEDLGAFEILMQLKGKLDIELLKAALSTVPEYVMVNTLNVTATEMIITGNANSYDSVALFQYQLRQFDQFSQVFVPSVVKDQGSYAFTITTTFKQEVPDANQ